MNILETALLEMCRERKKEFFYPEDIIRQMYPEDWKHFLPELDSLIKYLLRIGQVEIQDSKIENGRIKIRCLTKPKT